MSPVCVLESDTPTCYNYARIGDANTEDTQRLEQEGWYLQRHGSRHDIYRHTEIEGIISVPRHPEVKPGVARTIARKAGWEY